MKRRILIAVLALGTVGGYASGFHHLRCHGRDRQASFERHVAKVCVDAARGSGNAARAADVPPE